jgi:hypothetical protein
MTVLDAIAWFFGGALLINTIPHLVAGISGRPFQSPFATPRGIGMSSSTVNALWGYLNLVVGYLLLWQVGSFDAGRIADTAIPALGGLLMALFMARHFGRINGGADPDSI